MSTNGGQAIVGTVNNTGGGGGLLENGNQPHATDDARTLVAPSGAPVLCYDAERDALPIASGERESPLPDARRRQGKRGA